MAQTKVAGSPALVLGAVVGEVEYVSREIGRLWASI